MRQPTHNVRLPGWAWSLVVAAEAANRATSYLGRPPRENGLSLIEEQMHYSSWAVLLLAGAAVLTGSVGLWLAGHTWPIWFVFVGHLVLAGCTGIFTMSVTWSCLFLGQAWSGLMPLAIVLILHAERLLCVGTNIGRVERGQ